jgi:BASS family bile acid:Na+ symporter
VKRFLDKYLLLIAMVIGIGFYRPLSVLSPLTPFLLSAMLFITYTRVSWHDIRLTKFHYILLGIQYIGSAAVYLVLRPLNEILAQSAMICVLAPTATSAPVVAGILGGSISAVAAYSMISNLLVAFIAPLFLSVVGHAGADVSFAVSFWYIFKKVMPVLVLPFVCALLLRKVSFNVYKKVQSAQIVSFYLWAVTITILIAGGFVVEYRLLQQLESATLQSSRCFCAHCAGFGNKRQPIELFCYVGSTRRSKFSATPCGDYRLYG